jgi:hypothetical protein
MCRIHRSRERSYDIPEIDKECWRMQINKNLKSEKSSSFQNPLCRKALIEPVQRLLSQPTSNRFLYIATCTPSCSCAHLLTVSEQRLLYVPYHRTISSLCEHTTVNPARKGPSLRNTTVVHPTTTLTSSIMKRSKLDFAFFVASASVLLCAIYYNGLTLRRAWRAHNERPLDSYSEDNPQ